MVPDGWQVCLMNALEWQVGLMVTCLMVISTSSSAPAAVLIQALSPRTSNVRGCCTLFIKSPRGVEEVMRDRVPGRGLSGVYRGTLLIRNRPPP